MEGAEGTALDELTQHSKSSDSLGVLYMVSTPIGNLEDITLRALKVLKQVDIIAAETVGHSRNLLRHYGIKGNLISYNQHNHKAKGSLLMDRLKSGLHVAYLTNAGTPGISDPGALLVQQALEQGIRVSPIPGPSAITAALSVSGMGRDGFVFIGFLSNHSGKRRKELKGIVSEPRDLLFFEAPHRLKAALGDLIDILGNRCAVLHRELTKCYEEIKRGTIREILEAFRTGRIRGELTLVVAGNKGVGQKAGGGKVTREDLEILLTEEGMSLKDAATRLSLERGLTYRDAYRACLAVKRNSLS